jgi:hypothetical protein
VNIGLTVRVLPHLVNALVRVQRGQPIAMSFDIADYCTLKCPYCYWLESTRHKQLERDAIVAITRSSRALGVIHATWVGGEPALRPDVLEAVVPLVPLNWVVTNGMRVRPMVKGYDRFDLATDLGPSTWIIVSLDGVGPAHDRSRNHPGLYQEIVNRFYRTARSPRTLITTTLHPGNRDQPKALLEAWRRSGVLGMTFEFATAIGRPACPGLDLVADTRDCVIDELVALKRRYGSFMKNSLLGLEMQRARNLAAWTGPDRCPTTAFSLSYDSLGRRKSPCVLGSSPLNPHGKRPDCNACGCHVPTLFDGMRRLDWQTLQAAFWFLS